MQLHFSLEMVLRRVIGFTDPSNKNWANNVEDLDKGAYKNGSWTLVIGLGLSI